MKIVDRFFVQTDKHEFVDYERLRAPMVTQFEHYFCKCETPRWNTGDVLYNQQRRCKECNCIPLWLLMVCTSCRKPYIRDFRTTYDHINNTQRHKTHKCWDCNTDPVVLSRQVIRTFTAEDYADSGIEVFEL